MSVVYWGILRKQGHPSEIPVRQEGKTCPESLECAHTMITSRERVTESDGVTHAIIGRQLRRLDDLW